MKEEIKTKRENGRTYIYFVCSRCGEGIWRRKDNKNKKTDMCQPCTVISRNLTHG